MNTSLSPSGSFSGRNRDDDACAGPGWFTPAENLPAGLTARTGDCGNSLIISGTPADPGVLVLSGTVSDGESPAQTATWSVTLAISPAPSASTSTTTAG